MAFQLTSTTSIEYDSSKPIRETIKATGRLAVTAASVLCESAELTRDVIILARLTLKESLIEASIDTRTAEIAGLTKLHEQELEYQATLASLKA